MRQERQKSMEKRIVGDVMPGKDGVVRAVRL